MSDRIETLEDLRALLSDGATPSKLIQHVMSRLGSISYPELCGMFEDAFHVPVARLSPSSAVNDHRGSILNKTLLMEIVQRAREWRSQLHNPLPNPSWLDGLNVESHEQIASQVRSASFPGLSSQSWSMLAPEEREALQRQLAGSIVNAQRVEVLARLAERLQEKLAERDETGAMEGLLAKRDAAG